MKKTNKTTKGKPLPVAKRPNKTIDKKKKKFILQNVDKDVEKLESSASVVDASAIPKKDKKIRKKNKNMEPRHTEEEDKRTIFVGNVNIKAKRKQIARFFSKYGKVETVRIRCAAISEPQKSKREAVIKGDFHTSRSSIIAFVRFENCDMMEASLEANGVEFMEMHLRVDRAINRQEQDRKRAVFVGNLIFQAEEEKLRKHFSDCGEIESVRIVRDKKLGSGKGFAYVNFKSADSVEVALQMNDTTFMGRQLRVQRCFKKIKPKRKMKAELHTKKRLSFMKPNKDKKENNKLEGESEYPGRKMLEIKQTKQVKDKTTKKVGGLPTKKGLTFMKPAKDKRGKKKSKAADEYSGKKMLETKQFKKMKKAKGKLNKTDRKKLFIAHQLTGTKPRMRKTAS